MKKEKKNTKNTKSKNLLANPEEVRRVANSKNHNKPSEHPHPQIAT